LSVQFCGFVTPAIVAKLATAGTTEIGRSLKRGKLRERSSRYSRRPRA
jgi:hypothetical protein